MSRSAWINPRQPHESEAVVLHAGVERERSRATFGFSPRHYFGHVVGLAHLVLVRRACCAPEADAVVRLVDLPALVTRINADNLHAASVPVLRLVNVGSCLRPCRVADP
jgi:hypothetical protein